ncbi:epidermal growth factor-like protein [Drosophila albomicans]|uniref:Epidermal growth factor-like protein n=1 Tax=Drosophila albomicans TaxID=7291 RepID=A0A9C6T0G8_DROAB|nr:epidermal growth factor-like protein [Drosophila albomicans]
MLGRGIFLLVFLLLPASQTCHVLCQNGYELDSTTNRCIPVCSTPCCNGICTAPDKCECLDGYVRESDSICLPHCENECLNGYCIVPEKCACKYGYSTTDGKICQPICDGGCVNGFCSAPGECTCNDGYSKLNATNCINVPTVEAHIMTNKTLLFGLIGTSVLLLIGVVMYIFRKRANSAFEKEEQFGTYFSIN